MTYPLAEPLIDGPGQPTPFGEMLSAWHAALSGDRGGRAALRRAITSSEAFDATPFLRLCAQAMARFPKADVELLTEQLAPIAIVIAEIDQDGADAPGSAFAKPAECGKALSEDRLRLLAGSDDLVLFLRLLRSAIVQTGRRQSVLLTAELVRRWQASAHVRERARRRLLIDYIQAAG